MGEGGGLVRKIIKILLIYFLFVSKANAHPSHSGVPEIPGAEPSFIVGFETINIPERKILLIRTLTELCSFQIVRSGTNAVGGNAVPYVDYEIHRFRMDGVTNDGSRVGRFESKGYFMLGHLPIDKSNVVWKCGGNRLAWYYPNRVSFANSTKLFIAPTAWTNISKIDFHDSRLRWFEEDKTTERKEIVLPVDVLPGYLRE